MQCTRCTCEKGPLSVRLWNGRKHEKVPRYRSFFHVYRGLRCSLQSAPLWFYETKNLKPWSYWSQPICWWVRYVGFKLSSRFNAAWRSRGVSDIASGYLQVLEIQVKQFLIHHGVHRGKRLWTIINISNTYSKNKNLPLCFSCEILLRIARRWMPIRQDKLFYQLYLIATLSRITI